VVAYDPYVGDARFQLLRVRRAATLEELLDACDVLTVHTPLTDETRGMIGRRELARLSPGAVVVNMARGGIVDEAALAAALAGGQLRGAVLDVFTAEPPPPTTRSAARPTCCSRRTSAPTPPRRSATWRWTCAPPCATRCSTASSRGR
jgi:phosphoglycerate dehydrogenase-like enzyme